MRHLTQKVLQIIFLAVLALLVVIPMITMLRVFWIIGASD